MSMALCVCVVVCRVVLIDVIVPSTSIRTRNLFVLWLTHCARETKHTQEQIDGIRWYNNIQSLLCSSSFSPQCMCWCLRLALDESTAVSSFSFAMHSWTNRPNPTQQEETHIHTHRGETIDYKRIQ